MIDVQTFIGEAPRLSPRNLPANAAQSAVNCRMETTDLLAWRQFVSEKVLAAAATTIYKLNGAWLSWNADVDVARGPIPGDTNYFTFLTAPSLYATPRYTTYALATTGAEPYPVTTYPVGMPAPTAAPSNLAIGVDSTPTTTSVNTTDDGTVLATSWSVNSPSTGPRYFTVTQGAGFYLATYDENRDPGQEAYAYRNFGISGLTAVSVTADVRFEGDTSVQQACLTIAAGGAGGGVRVVLNQSVLYIQKATAWGAQFFAATLASAATTPTAGATDYNLRASLVTNTDGTKTVIASLYNGAVLMGTVTATNTFEDGDLVGISNGVSSDSGTQYQTRYDNIVVTGSGPNGVVITNQATSYVYTFVNNNVGGTGTIWESAPSPASETILRPDGVSVTVTTATTHAFDAGYGINRKYIYRSITGATGTVFYLVADIALATADYVDEFDDSEISNPGTVLPSEEWDLPPTGLKGIISLPNESMCGFFANQLCFSEPGRPHAWPTRYRQTAATDIVAIKNIDNTVVIGQAGPLQVSTGNIPGNYSMSEPGEPQACVSKRSMSYVDGYGVVYASPDGFQVCAGSAGNVKNATAAIFTKEQWEALTPSSIRSAVYDGNLFWYFTGGTPDAGYMLDTKPGGAGLVRLEHHATALHVDPLTDSLFMILDVNTEPTEAALPVASTAVTPTTTTIFQFDAHATNKVRYLWKGKLHLLPFETVFHFAQVQCESYENVVLRIYGDGALIYTVRVTSGKAFRIPALTVYDTYELALVGTNRVRTAQLAQHVEEFS